MNGTIFDINEFSIHDGPGARITVFMKGCPLRCVWCHNPEGLSREPQLMYKKNICAHCDRCKIPCKHPECKAFDRCIHSCPNGCLSVSGKIVSSKELFELILKNKDFFEMTRGGVTFSGGEPMLQSEFVCEVVDSLVGIHKAIQTSGFADLETYKRTVDKFDFVMQDIKFADEAEHIKYTGVSNERILNNIEFLKERGENFVFRVPLIPGITDTTENLEGISRIVGESPVELLKYNPLSSAKYEMLDMEYELSVNKNRDEDFTKYFSNAKMG